MCCLPSLFFFLRLVRPQVLVLLKVDMASMEKDEFDGPDRNLAHFAESLKMGKSDDHLQDLHMLTLFYIM